MRCASDSADRSVAWARVFGYFSAGRDGWVITLDGAARGMDDELPRQQPAAQFGDPASWSFDVDDRLLRRLLDCWRVCYLQRRQRTKLRRLFRSLEVAFHASLFPADGLTSINDVGTRIALWVSAFEILCHPGTGDVNKREVQRVLSAAPFDRRELVAQRFIVSHRGQRRRATLPEALYDDLYWARNQFLHGMPVTTGTLHFRQSPSLRMLTQIAPILYNVALVSMLDRLSVPGGPMAFGTGTLANHQEYLSSRLPFGHIQRGLVAARDRAR